MKILPFKAVYPDMAEFITRDVDFKRVRDEYPLLRKGNFFKKLRKKAFYIYQICGKKKHTGIIVNNALEDYLQNRILGHEKTLAIKESAIVGIASSCNAMTKPVLLTYLDNDEIHHWVSKYTGINKPLLEIRFDDNDEIQRLWKVSNEAYISQLKTLFYDHIPLAYIADGHHRSSALVDLLKNKTASGTDQDGLLCAYFPFSALEIYDFSRVVRIRHGLRIHDILDRLPEFCYVQPLQMHEKPTEKHMLTMFTSTGAYALVWKPDWLKNVLAGGLTTDVEIFNKYILEEGFKVHNLNDTGQIEYVNGKVPLQHLIQLAQEIDVAVFNFFPLTMQEIVEISNAGKTLPPKSTWFEPRIKNGIIIQEFRK